MGDSHKMLVSANIKIFDVDNNIKHDFDLSTSDTHDWMVGIKTDDVLHEQPMKSFNKNWLQMFFKNQQGRAMYVIYNYAGSRSSGGVTFNPVIGNAGALDGICLGTGSLTPSFYIYNLNYEVPTSILVRGGTTWVEPYISGSTYEFGLYRTFVATADVTASEMKICSHATNRNMWTYEKIDVSGSAINIPIASGSTATAWARFNIDENGPMTKNYLYAFYSALRSTNVTLRSTTSASAVNNFSNAAGDWSINSAAGNDIFGLTIGTDTSSFSIEDYKLYDKITNGTGPGQLLYLSTIYENTFADATEIIPDSHSYSNTVYRTFLNLSGGSVSIGECGIYLQGSTTSTEDNLKVMTARNPFPAHLTLQQREAVQVSYKFELTA